MSKYINADEYAKKLDYAWENYFRQGQSTEGIETALSILEDMPAAEVIETKMLTDTFLTAFYRKFAEAIEKEICGERKETE